MIRGLSGAPRFITDVKGDIFAVRLSLPMTYERHTEKCDFHDGLVILTAAARLNCSVSAIEMTVGQSANLVYTVNDYSIIFTFRALERPKATDLGNLVKMHYQENSQSYLAISP